ncbi:hypothetical protein PBY51_013939 [Eleginops maclovinus]|uniref:Uncharacterized protein n=1 Tax=Eleginops maclovinus TaxID=56733 RepID=A0AAN7WKL3_ELEMC|nr:hypothetical protein PBY51_013939 [Eleginops maclovinus]
MCQPDLFMLAVSLPPVETDVTRLVAERPRSAICQSRSGSPCLQWQGLTRFSWLGPSEGKGPGPSGAIALPPGAAPDRLGTSGQIWEGNVDGGAREGPAAREQPCSRAASQNSLLTANLQTRGETWLQDGRRLVASCSHDFSGPGFG